MKSNKKRGAIALIFVLLLPVILMLFSVMLDGILTQNIKNATSRYLDVSTLAVANEAKKNGCVITADAVLVGLNLFNKNMSSSGMDVDYTIVPIRTVARDKIGMMSFAVYGNVTSLNGNMFVP